MKIERTPFLQNFIVACASSIGFAIIFLAFKLNISTSFSDSLDFFIILITFILFMLILKTIFTWINIPDILDGLWIGVGLYCWSFIPKLFLFENYGFITALKKSTIYAIIGLVIIISGYLIRRKRNN